MKSGKIDLLNPAALLMLVGNYFVPSGMPKLFRRHPKVSVLIVMLPVVVLTDRWA
jgi:hypothetical protein